MQNTFAFINGALYALHFAGKFFVLPTAKALLWTVTAIAATAFVLGRAARRWRDAYVEHCLTSHTTEATTHDDTIDTALAGDNDAPTNEGAETVEPNVYAAEPNLLRWVDVSRITHQLGKALAKAAKAVASDSSLPHELEALKDIARRHHVKGWALFKNAENLRNKLIEGGVTA